MMHFKNTTLWEGEGVGGGGVKRGKYSDITKVLISANGKLTSRL